MYVVVEVEWSAEGGGFERAAPLSPALVAELYGCSAPEMSRMIQSAAREDKRLLKQRSRAFQARLSGVSGEFEFAWAARHQRAELVSVPPRPPQGGAASGTP